MVLVKESKEGQLGLVSNKTLCKGELVYKVKGSIISKPNRLSIQISETEHLYNGENDPLYLINHSCSPNTKFKPSEKAFIATKDIKKGEELTFNYNDNEAIIANPFKCWCGSNNCENEIKGYKKRSLN